MAGAAARAGQSRPSTGRLPRIDPDAPPAMETPGVLPRSSRLKVLIVSHWFPPTNVIGAVRVGKFAQYLHEAGHEVRVVAGRVRGGDDSLALEVPADRIAYVEGKSVGEVFHRPLAWLRRNRRGTQAALGAEPGARAPRGLVAALTRHYHALLLMPDYRAGWIRPATLAGYALVRDWRPDIVFASAPPNSALIVAARIARVCGAPWIAELRDLWVDNPYYEEPAWRWWIDLLFERIVLKSAAGLVTVSPDWARTLRRRHRQPVACVLNGYVAADLPQAAAGPPPGDVVEIAYTGAIYRGFRDPSPLFEAIARLGGDRVHVAVHFYGPSPDEVLPLAAAHGVADRIFVHDRVPYAASLALQTAADVLLLMQWNNRKDAGNIPAKFFEYLGAGRPILLLGYEHGDLARMLRERRAGIVANEPAAIAAQLRRWIEQRPTRIPALDRSARAGLSRAEQFRRLEAFLTDALGSRRRDARTDA
jgi:glycosyltransferase involved in cell wall biosynthesis